MYIKYESHWSGKNLRCCYTTDYEGLSNYIKELERAKKHLEQLQRKDNYKNEKSTYLVQTHMVLDAENYWFDLEHETIMYPISQLDYTEIIEKEVNQ